MKEFVEEICSFSPRGAGSKGEREAQEAVVREMKGAGIEVFTEEFLSHRSLPYLYLAHWLPMAFCGLLSFKLPVLSFIFGSFIFASFVGEGTSRFFWIRRFIPKWPSLNGIGILRKQNPRARAIVSAHADTARTGIIFHPFFLRLLMRGKGMRPLKPILAAMAFLWVVLLVRAFCGVCPDFLKGVREVSCPLRGGDVLLFFQWAGTGSLFLFSLMAAQWAFSSFSPGANDNASGLALLPSMAYALAESPPAHTEIWFVSTGAKESCSGGMQAFLRKHAMDLEPERTFLIVLDSVGGGKIRYAAGEGLVFANHYRPYLVAMAEKIRREVPAFSDVTEVELPGMTDALPPSLKGYPAMAITGLDEHGIPPRSHRKGDGPQHISFQAMRKAEEFALELIRRLDEDAGRWAA